jgi:hypothetical protein
MPAIPILPEDRFSRKSRNDMTYDTGSRQNGNIHLWMTEEPKEMLV